VKWLYILIRREICILIEAVVFDIDDTLVTHSLAIEKAIKEFYNEFFEDDLINSTDFYEMWQEQHDKYVDQYINGEITFEDQRVLRIQGVFEKMGKTLNESLARKYFNYYLRAYESNWRLFSEVREGLEDLKNYKLGIVSNGDSEQQRQKLRKTKIINHFESIIISGDIGITKPNKFIFDKILTKLDVEANKTLYIGDKYEKDFLGADNAGFHACLIDRDLSKPLETIEGNFKVNSLDELSEVVSAINKKE
jgi:putative hydrolase of the HAD superfamily